MKFVASVVGPSSQPRDFEWMFRISPHRNGATVVSPFLHPEGMTLNRVLIVRYASSRAGFLDGPERTRQEYLIRLGEPFKRSDYRLPTVQLSPSPEDLRRVPTESSILRTGDSSAACSLLPNNTCNQPRILSSLFLFTQSNP